MTFLVGSRKFDAEDTFRRCEVLDRHLTDGNGTAETHLQFGRLTLQRDRFGDQQVRVRIETRSGRLLDCGSDDLHVGDVRIAGGNPCRGGINRVINERSVRILRERYGEFRRVVAYRTFLRVGVCGFGGGRFEHLKVFAGFVPRDFPRQGSYVVREPDADSSSDDAVTVIVTLRPFDGSETPCRLWNRLRTEMHTLRQPKWI